MSEQPTNQPDDDAPQEDLDDVPAAAGGTDDTAPAQGEGESDSY